jgi:hypothetical protein
MSHFPERFVTANDREPLLLNGHASVTGMLRSAK